jgi:serine/threonine-protein kinase
MTAELLGQTLGYRYRFDALLGEGTFAHVFRVTDLHRRATLAAKVLRRDIAQDPAFLERFQREAAVLAHLQHPNIVRYYDTIEADGYIFLLVDYIPGRTLQTLLGSLGTALKPSASLVYLTPLASALQFAHHEGIIHRDLKPANILIHENGTLYITDFGIARILNTTSELTLGMTVGTPLYMSPEQILGMPVTPATDIYALGVILYRMYTGLPPFRGDNPRASGTTAASRITYEHVHLSPEPPARLNPTLDIAVQQIVLRCVEKDPARRFRSVNDLYDALAEAVGAPPLTADETLDPRPDVKLPEWSQFMAQPVAEAPSQPLIIETEPDDEDTSDAVPVQLAPEAPSPLPPTEPHLEKQLRESARTLANQNQGSDSPRTIPSLGRISPQAERPTLTHQHIQQARPPAMPAPAYVAAPAPPRPRRRLMWIAMLIGALMLIGTICAAVYYLATYEDQSSSSSKTTITPIIVTGIPDGGWIVFDSERNGSLDLFVVGSDGSDLRPLTTAPGIERGGTWSPDGTRIAFYGATSDTSPYDLFVMDADGTHPVNLTNTPDIDERYPTWSPDGTQIAFQRNSDEDFDLYLINANGGGLLELTSNDNADLGPDWSPDGTQIVFHTDAWGEPEKYDIAVIDLATQQTRRLTDDSMINSFATWSPDGTQIAYHAINSAGTVNVFVVTGDGSGARQITHSTNRSAFPDWSPDGSLIVYQNGPHESSAIYAIPAAGGTPRAISDGQSDFMPNWRP